MFVCAYCWYHHTLKNVGLFIVPNIWVKHIGSLYWVIYISTHHWVICCVIFNPTVLSEQFRRMGLFVCLLVFKLG